MPEATGAKNTKVLLLDSLSIADSGFLPLFSIQQCSPSFLDTRTQVLEMGVMEADYDTSRHIHQKTYLCFNL